MAKAESRYSQIAGELWEVGLTWKVYKLFSVQEETACMQHTLFLAYISKTNETKKPHKPNKPTISTREIHNTYKGSAIAFKQKKPNQPTKDRCVGKCIKQSSDFKCDSLVKVTAFLLKYYHFLFPQENEHTKFYKNADFIIYQIKK